MSYFFVTQQHILEFLTKVVSKSSYQNKIKAKKNNLKKFQKINSHLGHPLIRM